MTSPAVTSTVIRVWVNGRDVEMLVPVRLTVAELLRDRLGLTGTKVSCEMQVCGVCTVLVDGNPVSSCATLACDLDGTEVLTVEGLARGRDLHPVQEAFMSANAPAVRLLHARVHHDGRRPARRLSRRRPPRGAGVDGRQPVPLHRLRTHRDRGHRRGPPDWRLQPRSTAGDGRRRTSRTTHPRARDCRRRTARTTHPRARDCRRRTARTTHPRARDCRRRTSRTTHPRARDCRRMDAGGIGGGAAMTGEPRRDAWEKVTGRARYAVDAVLPNMAHAAVVRSERAHAHITGIDRAEAAAAPGVIAVVTAGDLGDLGRRFGHIVPDHAILAEGKVRYYGEPVAVVVAETPHQAADAAETGVGRLRRPAGAHRRGLCPRLRRSHPRAVLRRAGPEVPGMWLRPPPPTTSPTATSWPGATPRPPWPPPPPWWRPRQPSPSSTATPWRPTTPWPTGSRAPCMWCPPPSTR